MVNSAFVDYINKNRSLSTRQSYLKDITEFQEWLLSSRGKQLKNCASSDAVSYLLYMSQSKLSASSIRRKLESLKFYYNWLQMSDLGSLNPFRDCILPSQEIREIKALSEQDMVRIIEAASGYEATQIRDKAILEFLYDTGARVSELVDVHYGDINFKMNFITLSTSALENRIVPLSSYLKDALLLYIEDAYPKIFGRPIEPGDILFINTRGNPITRQGIWYIIKHYAGKLGFSDISPMVFRDSFAIHMIKRGADIKSLQELMGFSDISSCYAYIDSSKVHVRDVYNNSHPRS